MFENLQKLGVDRHGGGVETFMNSAQWGLNQIHSSIDAPILLTLGAAEEDDEGGGGAGDDHLGVGGVVGNETSISGTHDRFRVEGDIFRGVIRVCCQV